VEAPIKTLHGNGLTIEFKYPEENPPDYISDVANALSYVGVFDGISPPFDNDA
jgi:hypothetical protein